MRLGRLLGEISWTRASGELVLIIAGVLLALALNNWNIDRQERRVELSILREFRASLDSDLAILKQAHEELRVREQRIESLAGHLDRELPYNETLAVNFGSVLGFLPIHLNRSPYDALKTRGLDAISAPFLRLRLVKLYDQTYAGLEGDQDDDRNVVLEVVRPYYLGAFRAIRFRESATPLKYGEVVQDVYFRNLVDYRLTSLRANVIGPVANAITDVAEVIKGVDNETERLK